MLLEKREIAELGEMCVRIGQKILSSPIEELNHEELVIGKKAGKTFIDHFKLKVTLNDDSYSVLGKFRDLGKKELSLNEIIIFLIQESKTEK